MRRNIVTGFFDTIYWSRQFRKSQDYKKAGRLAMIPQFIVPEILVDGTGSPEGSPVEPNMPSASPFGGASRSTGNDAITLTPPDSPRRRSNSIQRSPTRGGTSLSPFDAVGQSSGVGEESEEIDDGNGSWRLARALSSAPSPLLEPATASGGSGGSSPSRGHSRANSAVTAQNVLDVLDNSAWGESIRKSFSTRRSLSSRNTDAPGRQ